MLRIPQKGSTTPVDFGEMTGDDSLKGVGVSVKYVGAADAHPWALQANRIRLEDGQRLGEMRKGFSKDQIPELYAEDAVTTEGLEAYSNLACEVFERCIAGPVFGVEGEVPPLELVNALPLGYRVRVMNECISLQSLSKAQFFRPAGAGGMEA